MWEKFNEMFPQGGIWINNEYITKDYLIKNNINTIGTVYMKPIRSMIENKIQYYWHSDNSFESWYIYNLMPKDTPDGLSVLNAYGRKIYNDFIDKKGEK